MKYLGIDYGEKRVGLAVTSKDEKIVLPYKTLKRLSKQQITDEIKNIVDELEVDAIVVGIPGEQDSLIVRQIQNFISLLKKKINRPIYTIDEQLSSFEAEYKLRERGLSSKKIKNIIDQIAAQDILNTFLSKQKKDEA